MEQDDIKNLQEINKALWKELAEKNRRLEIETSLEKVRGRTMTMRASAELSETSAVLFHELNQLGIETIRTGVGIFDDANTAMELWSTSVSDNKEVLKKLDYFSLYIHPVYENLISAREQQKPYALTKLKGNQVKYYYQSMTALVSSQHVYNEEEYFYSFFFGQGTLNVVMHQPLSDEECIILTQFAHAFGLIYTRFLDLQKAEDQTREALRKAALDRIRAEIASMRTADDLKHITPLIWKELITFDVPFTRCGIFIIREDEKLVYAYLSSPEGKSLAILRLAFEGNETTAKMIDSWRNKTVYKEQWDRGRFQDWVQSMYGHTDRAMSDEYAATGSLFGSTTLNLYFIPFSQGMLYIGGQEVLVESEIDLVRSLADAFSVAYARYEDFKQLEDAKNKIEATLSELKATQSQLVQSEKMASLGELTAGIAHEIQNPLNFVNNFSDVNKELIGEMNEELDKGNYEEAKKIAKDISDNEHKIHHHGKRADAIVKGMLQHSRTSGGQKEPTNINALADEYLRLAYHGLRAKDKTFNAHFKTQFDNSIGKINIVPQDIGRVILNLINNAFYAVNEKQKAAGHGYEPTVIVSTSTNGRLETPGTVEISVQDNGNGVPQKILDKIFQPFFTTKPTGQGTGLGLSLAYDIITKGHGGELKVETKEGEGSTFIISLPAQSN